MVGDKEFSFEFSELEKRLMDLGGIAQAFNKHGKGIFEALSRPQGGRQRVGGSKVFEPSGKGGDGVGKAAAGDGKEKAGLEW